MIMDNPKVRVFAKKSNNELDIYLDVSGSEHYLITRRINEVLYKFLKNGKTIRELSRIRPRSSRRYEQCLYHSTQHLHKVVESYIQYELAA